MSAWEAIFSAWMPDPGGDPAYRAAMESVVREEADSSAAEVHPSRWTPCRTPTPAGKQPRCASPSAEAFCWASG